ncbi:TMPRSS11B [Acrasis kona]|uniref:TMPRSS11B n=1 Tax=Acrasis kona TaxID=1008807 RepID=A0AAW2YUQ3_9EUKA
MSAKTKDTSSTDSGQSSTREFVKRLKFGVSIADFVLIVLGVLAIVMCLVGGLTGYFVMEKIDVQNGVQEFMNRAKTISDNINNDIADITNDLLLLQKLMTVFQNVDFYNQFLPFSATMSTVPYINGTVKLPDYMLSYAYIQVVPYDNLTSYFDTLQSWGGTYRNVSYVKAFGSTVPDVKRSEYFLITLYIPERGNAGTNLASLQSRNDSFVEARAKREIVVTDKLYQNGVRGDASGVSVYAPVIRNNVTIGFVQSAIIMKALLKSSSASSYLSGDQSIALIEDTGTIMTILTNNEQVNKPNGNYSQSDVDMLVSQSALSDSNNQISVYNRKYKMIVVSSVMPVQYLKVIPLALCLFTMLVIEALLVFAYCYRKVVVVNKIQELTKARVELLENHRAKLSNLLKTSIRSEAKSRGIINSIPDPVVVINATGLIVQSNNSFDALFAETENAEVLLSSILVDLDPNFFVSMQQGEVMKTNASLKNGTKMQVEVKVSNIVDDKREGSPNSSTPSKSPHIQLVSSIDEEESYVVIIREIL